MLPALRRRGGSLSRVGPETNFLQEFENLRSDLFRVFDRWPWSETASEDGFTAAYPMDVIEEDGKIVVNAELPGFTKDQVNVSVDNGMLRISAERKEETTKGRKHVHERRYERVERCYTLPTGVSDGKASAKLENGVLHLELPKSAETKSHQISVT